MAELDLSSQESLICLVCLDVFINPVIIPCGHSFCKDCITAVWEQVNDDDDEGCPQCYQTFSRRPELIECVILKDLCEKVREKPQIDAEAHDVRCDVCAIGRVKAVKSCLTCLSSYCSLHTDRHNDLHKGKKHQLIHATDLQSKTCRQHGKLLELFCATDHQCICVRCVLDEHKSHDIISAADERSEKQKKLMGTLVRFLQNIQDRENDLKELTKTEESIRRSAETTVEECERIFTEVIGFLQKTCGRVQELVLDKERSELKNVEEVQEKVQQEIVDMKMKLSEFNQLLSTEDHVHFIQNYPSQSEDCRDLPSISLHQNAPFQNVMMLISTMQERLLDVSKETELKVSREVSSLFSPPASAGEYKTVHDDNSSYSCKHDQNNVVHFGESMTEFSFSFQLDSPSKPSFVPNQSRLTSVKTDNKQKVSWENQPVVPDIKKISTGEENEQVVFRHRARLFCFDGELCAWKERGVGDLKILKNYKTKRTRVVMRREQVLKLCANHHITSHMKLKPVKDSVRSWTWTALDFTDGKGEIKQLAVRFRLQETAEAFKEIFEEANF